MLHNFVVPRHPLERRQMRRKRTFHLPSRPSGGHFTSCLHAVWACGWQPWRRSAWPAWSVKIDFNSRLYLKYWNFKDYILIKGNFHGERKRKRERERNHKRRLWARSDVVNVFIQYLVRAICSRSIWNFILMIDEFFYYHEIW